MQSSNLGELDSNQTTSRPSKSGFWSTVERVANSKAVTMINEIGDSLNPFITVPADVHKVVNAIHSGDIVAGLGATAMTVLDLGVVLPVEGAVVKGVQYGSKTVSRLGLFTAKSSASTEKALLRKTVLDNIAENQVARKSSYFGIHSASEEAFTLDVSTGRDMAVFWSGRGNRELAERYALHTGKVTLEMTPGGRLLDSLMIFDKYLGNRDAIRPWEILSKRYAENASGQITAFVEGARPVGVFARIENPILLENRKISKIVLSSEFEQVKQYSIF